MINDDDNDDNNNNNNNNDDDNDNSHCTRRGNSLSYLLCELNHKLQTIFLSDTSSHNTIKQSKILEITFRNTCSLISAMFMLVL